MPAPPLPKANPASSGPPPLQRPLKFFTDAHLNTSSKQAHTIIRVIIVQGVQGPNIHEVPVRTATTQVKIG